MKFGKLTSIATVDFSLPPEPVANASVLSGTPVEDFEFYTGCTGWGMTEWVGKWYPPKTQAKDFLEHYAQQFNTIEFNSTHYRIPTVAQVEKWCAKVPADFRFCPKVPQTISHSKQLGLGGDQLPLFWSSLSAFGERLGACFMQLPPYFQYTQLAQLETLLRIWPTEFSLAIELRHPSWFASEEVLQHWGDVLGQYQMGAVITDVAGRRDVLHQRLTVPWTMIRFVGNGLHPTDYERTHTWARLLEQWKQQGLTKAYYFPHEPDNLLAPEMTAYLVDYLHAQTTITTRGPRPVTVEPQSGEQISLF